MAHHKIISTTGDRANSYLFCYFRFRFRFAAAAASSNPGPGKGFRASPTPQRCSQSSYHSEKSKFIKNGRGVGEIRQSLYEHQAASSLN